MKKTSELKSLSREALLGRYSVVIVSYILISLAGNIGSGLSTAFFGGDSILQLAMGQCFDLIISLLVSILTVGLFYMMLKISRGGKPSYDDLFYLFRHQPDRVIVVSFILVAVEAVTTLPGSIYFYRSGLLQFELNDGNYLLYLQKLLLALAINEAGVLLAALLTMPFSMSCFLIADDDGMDAPRALRESMRMMKGHYGQYIYLNLSFAGMFLLGIASLGIGLLWIDPYIQMTQIQFYRSLRGEAVDPETPLASEGEQGTAVHASASFGRAARVLGIIAIFLGFSSGVGGIMLGALGITFALLSDSRKSADSSFRMSVIACLVGMVAGVIVLIASFSYLSSYVGGDNAAAQESDVEEDRDRRETDLFGDEDDDSFFPGEEEQGEDNKADGERDEDSDIYPGYGDDAGFDSGLNEI